MQDASRLREQQMKDLATVFVRQFSGDELARSVLTFQWVLETCNFDDGKGFQSIADWADSCVSVGWAWMIKRELVIADLRGSIDAREKAEDLFHLHGVLKATSMVDHYPWLKSVVQDIEVAYLDITGVWDTV